MYRKLSTSSRSSYESKSRIHITRSLAAISVIPLLICALTAPNALAAEPEKEASVGQTPPEYGEVPPNPPHERGDRRLSRMSRSNGLRPSGWQFPPQCDSNPQTMVHELGADLPHLRSRQSANLERFARKVHEDTDTTIDIGELDEAELEFFSTPATVETTVQCEKLSTSASNAGAAISNGWEFQEDLASGCWHLTNSQTFKNYYGIDIYSATVMAQTACWDGWTVTQLAETTAIGIGHNGFSFCGTKNEFAIWQSGNQAGQNGAQFQYTFGFCNGPLPNFAVVALEIFYNSAGQWWTWVA